MEFSFFSMISQATRLAWLIIEKKLDSRSDTWSSVSFR